MILQTPISTRTYTLFPYTTRFRSWIWSCMKARTRLIRSCARGLWAKSIVGVSWAVRQILHRHCEEPKATKQSSRALRNGGTGSARPLRGPAMTDLFRVPESDAHLKPAISFGRLIFLNQKTLIWRSEEHTYELQSLIRISYAVCCLKKKI